MSIKDDYYIKEIDYHTAMNVVVKCHYAHRTAPCTRAFGLFSKPLGRIVGVLRRDPEGCSRHDQETGRRESR